MSHTLNALSCIQQLHCGVERQTVCAVIMLTFHRDNRGASATVTVPLGTKSLQHRLCNFLTQLHKWLHEAVSFSHHLGLKLSKTWYRCVSTQVLCTNLHNTFNSRHSQLLYTLGTDNIHNGKVILFHIYLISSSWKLKLLKNDSSWCVVDPV